jgi:hypothetical protein
MSIFFLFAVFHGRRGGLYSQRIVQYEKPDEWRLSKVKRNARSVRISPPFFRFRFRLDGLLTCFGVESNIWLRVLGQCCTRFVLFSLLMTLLSMVPPLSRLKVHGRALRRTV